MRDTLPRHFPRCLFETSWLQVLSFFIILRFRNRKSSVSIQRQLKFQHLKLSPQSRTQTSKNSFSLQNLSYYNHLEETRRNKKKTNEYHGSNQKAITPERSSNNNTHSTSNSSSSKTTEKDSISKPSQPAHTTTFPRRATRKIDSLRVRGPLHRRDHANCHPESPHRLPFSRLPCLDRASAPPSIAILPSTAR